ncbi:adenylate kinase [Tanacetum coccineum]
MPLAGMPLQLAGTRQILEYTDWGSDGAMGKFINIGVIGGKEVDEVDDIFILVAPQNAMGNYIIDVKIFRKSLRAQVIDRTKTMADVYGAFYEFSSILKSKVNMDDPNAKKTISRIEAVQRVCKDSGTLHNYVQNIRNFTILQFSRWFCSQCKKIQLYSSKRHTCQSGETNLFSEVAVNNVTLDTTDKDDVFVNSFFETHDAFLNKCQKSHFQFDTLSRAKKPVSKRLKLSIANPELMKMLRKERVRLLVGSSGASKTPSYSAGTSTTLSYSLGPSTPPSYSSGPLRNAECANCKLLIGKLQVVVTQKTSECLKETQEKDDEKLRQLEALARAREKCIFIE